MTDKSTLHDLLAHPFPVTDPPNPEFFHAWLHALESALVQVRELGGDESLILRLQRLADLSAALLEGSSAWVDAEGKWVQLTSLIRETLPPLKLDEPLPAIPESSSVIAPITTQTPSADPIPAEAMTAPSVTGDPRSIESRASETSKPMASFSDRLEQAMRQPMRQRKRHQPVLAMTSKGARLEKEIEEDEEEEGLSQPKEPVISDAPLIPASQVLDMSLLVLFLESNFGELDRMDGLAMDAEQGNTEARAEITRKIHTLKGELGLLGLSDETAFLHRLENQLNQGEFPVEAILEAIKRLKSMWERLVEASKHSGQYALAYEAESTGSGTLTTSQNAASHNASELTAGLQTYPMREDESIFLADFKTEAAEHFQSLAGFILELDQEPEKPDAINGVFRVYHTIKGVAGFLHLSCIQLMAHGLESLVARARSRQIALDAKLIGLLLNATDSLKEMIQQSFYSEGKATVMVHEKAAELLQQLHAVEQGRVEALARAKQIETGPTGGGDSRQGAVEDSLRISAKKLDHLFDALGEIVIAQSMIAADPLLQTSGRVFDRKELLALRQKIQASQTILNQVQQVTLSLRMISIKPTFVKMARLARDVSQKTNKPIDFVKEGEDTEIDKSFAEKLSDPLVHMIRNSIDHGIEPTPERLRAGKSEKGRLTLRAYHRSGRLFIEIEDDGKGLDTDVLMRKAIERGLAQEGAKLEPETIFRFILEPGFSTAQQVTDLSGRGVGMDVVRQSIEALGGALAIHSAKGQGTRFTLSLPLTLAIINGMFVKAGGQVFIIPSLAMTEVVNPSPGQVQSLSDEDHLLELRGKWIKLMRLSDAMGLTAKPPPFHEGVAIIVEDGMGYSLAIFVDSILSREQVVIKPLGEAIPIPEAVQGGAVGSDGCVHLIIDVPVLLSKSMQARQPHARPQEVLNP